jgi:hypothetical protein
LTTPTITVISTATSTVATPVRPSPSSSCPRSQTDDL